MNPISPRSGRWSARVLKSAESRNRCRRWGVRAKGGSEGTDKHAFYSRSRPAERGRRPAFATSRHRPSSNALKTETPRAAAPVQKPPMKQEAQTRPGVAYSRSADNHLPSFRELWEHNRKAKQIREASEAKALHRVAQASIGSAFRRPLTTEELRDIKRRCRPGHRRPDAALGIHLPPTPEHDAQRDAAWASSLAQMEHEWALAEARRQAAEAEKRAQEEELRSQRAADEARERERIAAECPRWWGFGKREEKSPHGRLRIVDCECKQ